eukprot:147757_1
MTKGNKMTKESIFRYFESICDDDECSSLSRNTERQHQLNHNDVNNDAKTEEIDIDIDINIYTDSNIWSKKQYYAQSTLDLIHSYFVHHDWKSDIHIDDDDNENKYKHLNIEMNEIKKKKYNNNNAKKK